MILARSKPIGPSKIKDLLICLRSSVVKIDTMACSGDDVRLGSIACDRIELFDNQRGLISRQIAISTTEDKIVLAINDVDGTCEGRGWLDNIR